MSNSQVQNQAEHQHLGLFSTRIGKRGNCFSNFTPNLFSYRLIFVDTKYKAIGEQVWFGNQLEIILWEGILIKK